MDGRALARTPGRPCRQRTAGRWARAGLHVLRGRSGSLGPARGTGKACTYSSGDGRLGGGLLCVSAQAGLLRALAGGLGKDGGSSAGRVRVCRRPPAPHALRTRAAVGRACGPGQAAWPGRGATDPPSLAAVRAGLAPVRHRGPSPSDGRAPSAHSGHAPWRRAPWWSGVGLLHPQAAGGCHGPAVDRGAPLRAAGHSAVGVLTWQPPGPVSTLLSRSQC